VAAAAAGRVRRRRRRRGAVKRRVAYARFDRRGWNGGRERWRG